MRSFHCGTCQYHRLLYVAMIPLRSPPKCTLHFGDIEHGITTLVLSSDFCPSRPHAVGRQTPGKIYRQHVSMEKPLELQLCCDRSTDIVKTGANNHQRNIAGPSCGCVLIWVCNMMWTPSRSPSRSSFSGLAEYRHNLSWIHA